MARRSRKRRRQRRRVAQESGSSAEVQGAESAPGDAARPSEESKPARTAGARSGSGSPGRSPRKRGARRRQGGPPSAPWGSFPLSELVVLIALVLLVAGFFVSAPRGPVMIGAGLVLGSLAGLELSVREHFSGYRSHTMLLAAAAGVLVTGLLLLLAGDTLAPIVCLAIGLLAAGLAGWRLTAAFRRRSGGAVFRVRGG